MPQFPIRVYSENDFQWIENESQYADLLKEYRYIQAAGGLVSDEAGRVLMIYRRGKWDFPKGKVEWGETVEAAAVREVEEETGIRADIADFSPHHVFHVYDTYGEKVLKETFWFRMTAKPGQMLSPQSEEDISRAEFVDSERVTSHLQSSYASLREVWRLELERK